MFEDLPTEAWIQCLQRKTRFHEICADHKVKGKFISYHMHARSVEPSYSIQSLLSKHKGTSLHNSKPHSHLVDGTNYF